MSQTPPTKIAMPPLPSAADFSALTDDSPAASPSYPFSPPSAYPSGSVPLPKSRRRSGRLSFSTAAGRSRRASRVTATGVDDMLDEDLQQPKLPTLVPGIRPAYSTPLPVLPMVVLCISMLSELLSANLCTPFLLKMVEDFFISSGRPKDTETEAAVGLWTGNLVSVFFITQFFTSLLWSSIADRHGRRAVIVASLAGSAIALMVFGTSESLPEAICVRLVQGIFGGAVGVFRGSIRDITDDTNATRAYAILGFSWGFGGVVGPILGGVFESPADNFSGTFLANIGLFQSFPYLLPTLIAGTILVFGSILACFLSWDGGVRGGSRIALPVEKNEPLAPVPARDDSPAPSAPTTVPSLRGKRSGFLSPRDTELAANGAGYPGVSGSAHPRRDSRASLGTAYGYGGIRSKHPTLAARAALEAARRVSTATVRRPDEDEDEAFEGESAPLGFAQKLLLANEENTFNINDLWVSAAVAQDTAVFEDETDDDEMQEEEEQLRHDETPLASPGLTPGSESRGSFRQHMISRSRIASGSLYRSLPSRRLSVSHGGRRFSGSSGTLPAIFTHTGLQHSPAIAGGHEVSPSLQPESDPFLASPAPERRPQLIGGLSVISERPGQGAVETSTLGSPSVEMTEEKESAWKALPLLMISQYGLLALHNTTHDQVFLSFLVTPYKSGGLGLNPANFSFLIALMCLFQLVYQFYLYPRLGPPLGRFSHLQMFRLGCSLYVPSYLALPLLHSVASPDTSGGFVVMTLLTLITAVRYCGGTLAYTSVMILINAMSPPHVIGLANGLAQSTVSFSRFFGPVIGGAVWSASINGNPGGYYKGFIVVALGCIVQWILSLLIR